jgi:hypothetical protein
MEDRRFTKLDLRGLLERATGYHEDIVPGRWVIETKRRRQAWEVIVEPDESLKILVVVTAYAV